MFRYNASTIKIKYIKYIYINNIENFKYLKILHSRDIIHSTKEKINDNTIIFGTTDIIYHNFYIIENFNNYTNFDLKIISYLKDYIIVFARKPLSYKYHISQLSNDICPKIPNYPTLYMSDKDIYTGVYSFVKTLYKEGYDIYSLEGNKKFIRLIE